MGLRVRLKASVDVASFPHLAAQHAILVGGPDPELAVRLVLAAHLDEVADPQRVDEPRGVADERALAVVQRGIDHQVHREAAVGDERRIAFLAACVVAVVVDAVRVPGERSVAEIERVGERGLVAPGMIGARLVGTVAVVF